MLPDGLPSVPNRRKSPGPARRGTTTETPASVRRFLVSGTAEDCNDTGALPISMYKPDVSGEPCMWKKFVKLCAIPAAAGDSEASKCEKTTKTASFQPPVLPENCASIQIYNIFEKDLVI